LYVYDAGDMADSYTFKFDPSRNYRDYRIYI